MSSEERSEQLLKTSGSDIERQLLASAADDEMPEEKFQALLKYGAGTALSGVATSTRSTWKLTLAKGLGLLALAAAGIGVFHHESSKPASTSAAVGEASGATPDIEAAPSETRPALPSVEPVPVVSLDALPSAPRAASSSASVASVARPVEKPSVDDDVSITEQMKLIDAARTRLRRDDPRGALAVLDEYERRFSAPAFKEEATVLRVSSLAKAGRRVDAKRVGEAFLAAHPSELYRRRVEAIVRTLSEKGSSQ